MGDCFRDYNTVYLHVYGPLSKMLDIWLNYLLLFFIFYTIFSLYLKEIKT